MDQQWHTERKRGLGGSDSPVILGVSPFKTPRELWEEKRSQDIIEARPTPAMQRGTMLEPVVAELYHDTTGRELVTVSEPYVDPELPVMRGNIDRLIDGNGTPPGVLEIKCPGLHVFGKIKREGVPEYYMVQLQHYLAVTGCQWGSLAVFNAEQWELLFFDVQRDDGLINLIRVKDAEFWQLVQEGVPPEEIDQTATLDLPKVGGELIKTDSEQWSKAVERLRVAQELKKEAEALEDEAKADIVGLMTAHEADVVEGAGARIYYREQSGRVSIDTARLRREMPDVAEKYSKQGKPFRSFRAYYLRGGE
jgi:putative phage-type endonuclease